MSRYISHVLRGPADSPEEAVMLHTHLPQSLSCSVVHQLETNGGLKLVKLGKLGKLVELGKVKLGKLVKLVKLV